LVTKAERSVRILKRTATYVTPASDLITVRVEPAGVTIDVRPGETLMNAAERQGYRWPTLCHGQALCTACSIVLNEDNCDAFEAPEAIEQSGLALLTGRSFYKGKVVRLACQARPVAETAVIKRGVRKRDDPTTGGVVMIAERPVR
jgi:ferredoxin, 2Fe-2S